MTDYFFFSAEKRCVTVSYDSFRLCALRTNVVEYVFSRRKEKLTEVDDDNEEKHYFFFSRGVVFDASGEKADVKKKEIPFYTRNVHLSPTIPRNIKQSRQPSALGPPLRRRRS